MLKWLRFSKKNTKKRILKNAHRIRKNQNFENRATSCFKLAQIRPRAKISWIWDFGGWEKHGQTERHACLLLKSWNTGQYGEPPLKIKISKIGLRSDLSWPKLGLEPKFHEPGTFGGFGKREQTHTHTDRQDSCFISIYYTIACHDISALKWCII